MKNDMTNKRISNTKKYGFTLVESLVAISILSMSIAATFTAVQSSLQNSSIAKDQTTAYYLAQEAVEIIKNKRDQNALYNIGGFSNTWLTGMSANPADPCYFGKVCRVDATEVSPNDIVYCGMSFDSCPVLNKEASGLFRYIGGTPTIFKRGVQLREVVPGVEVEVKVNISWTSRWGPKSFEITENIFNRQ